MAQLQFTDPYLGDLIVDDDGSMTLDGKAVKGLRTQDSPDGEMMIDINGNGIWDVNPSPYVCTIKITRGEVGFFATLEGIAEDIIETFDPGKLTLSAHTEKHLQGKRLFMTAPFYDVDGVWVTASTEHVEGDLFLVVHYDGAPFSEIIMPDGLDTGWFGCSGVQI